MTTQPDLFDSNFDVNYDVEKHGTGIAFEKRDDSEHEEHLAMVHSDINTLIERFNLDPLVCEMLWLLFNHKVHVSRALFR